MTTCELLVELRKELELIDQVRMRIRDYDGALHIAEVLDECQDRMQTILFELEQECRGLDFSAGKD